MSYSCLTTIRRIHSTKAVLKTAPKTLKAKGQSSQEWLRRQMTDPYVEKAKMMNYRCRSAFKLLEIDQKYGILRPGNVVIDCGASPGSWTQIAIERVNAHGRQDNKPSGLVVSVDLLPIYPIESAIVLGNSDFTNPKTQEKIRTHLDGRQIDCVLSDMAPNATGVRSLDQENITNLCYAVLRFALQMSRVNASLLMKVWDNGDVPKLEKDLLQYYKSVKSIKPNSSRNDSSEKFLLARQFVGLESK